MTVNTTRAPEDAYLSWDFGKNENDKYETPSAVFEKGRLNAYDIGGIRMLVEEFDNKGMIAGEKKAYVACRISAYFGKFSLLANPFITHHLLQI